MLIFLLLFLILPVQAQTGRSDESWKNHWAENDINKAVTEKWIDETQLPVFLPDETISRAEFLKLLEKVVHLTPDGNSSEFYQKASLNSNTTPFSDTATHWCLTEGWLNTALQFGLVSPSDYTDHHFSPDAPISRQESILMIIRSLGRVYPVTQNEHKSVLFTDWNSIPEWAKGYVDEMVNFKLLKGYPDGTAKTERKLTNAEAVALVGRTAVEMEQGIDIGIKVILENYFPKDNNRYRRLQVELPVPAQVINHMIYIPVKALYSNGGKLYSSVYAGDIRYYWKPETQILGFEYGVAHEFQAGNSYSGFYSNLLPFTGKFMDPGNQLASEVRILYGEIMIPVINNGTSAQVRSTGTKIWDANTKTITIPMNEPQAPIS